MRGDSKLPERCDIITEPKSTMQNNHKSHEEIITRVEEFPLSAVTDKKRDAFSRFFAQPTSRPDQIDLGFNRAPSHNLVRSRRLHIIRRKT